MAAARIPKLGVCEMEFYEVVDTQTGKVVGTVKSLKAASRKVDKLDNEYGAYRYVYRRAGADNPCVRLRAAMDKAQVAEFYAAVNGGAK